MRAPLLTLCALALLASPARAAKTSAPPKKSSAAAKPAAGPATLPDLVALVMKSGKPWSSNSALNARLGYTTPQVGKKFPSPQSKDGSQRGLVVTTDDKGKPKDIIFMYGRYSKLDGVVHLHESLNFRTDLDGNVLSAVSLTSVGKSGVFVPKDIGSDEVRARVKEEFKFHLARVK
ncbi:MAG: hypothetical protein SF051_16175 [Elusimicrobiota bacterium]|nr:hypothetical protein [Elusimicrobiota bacterium]